MSHKHTDAEHIAMATRLTDELRETLMQSRNAGCTTVVFSSLASVLLDFYVMMRLKGRDLSDDLTRLAGMCVEMAETDPDKLEALATFYSDQVNRETPQ